MLDLFERWTSEAPYIPIHWGLFRPHWLLVYWTDTQGKRDPKGACVPTPQQILDAGRPVCCTICKLH